MLVIFAGQGANSNFRHTICSRLKERARICEISSAKIACEHFPCDFTLVFEKNPIKIDATDSILVLNCLTTAQKVSGERYLIVNSSTPDDMNLAKNSGGEVIVCGLSLRDTLTFSSFTQDDCVLSLQRRIKRFDGSFADPFEIPLYCSESEDRYAILCASLLLILGGYL